MEPTPRHRPDDAPAHAAKHGETADDLASYALTIACPRDQLYAMWRDFSGLPSFMENVVSVTRQGDGVSHWAVKAPGGGTVEWDARILADEPGRRIAWQSLPGADVDNAGEVRFDDAPGGRGTVVRVRIDYDPPAGAIGRIVAKMFQREPQIQARRDLRRFKQLMETGEIATSAQTRAQAQAEKAQAEKEDD